jgi:hypothetical protein
MSARNFVTVQEAFTAGQDAFTAGRMRAPALNTDFIKLACASDEIETAELLGEYLRGWDRANLDAPVQPWKSTTSAAGVTSYRREESS